MHPYLANINPDFATYRVLPITAMHIFIYSMLKDTQVAIKYIMPSEIYTRQWRYI